MLLYTLLHGSKSFQGYVLLRSDPETLLVPLLQQLYKANKRRANHLYMLQVTAGLLRDRTVAAPRAGLSTVAAQVPLSLPSAVLCATPFVLVQSMTHFGACCRSAAFMVYVTA